ncbi:unnamed protein product [Cuscuta epithymum]|uniref:Uncharacterized protein n=1 Tax=Cuscuta epithymum TaxID=186058 RepID=A0AAV0EJI0_9ASTE|nr:unnamed protein product [Cuscuta epithymum]
MMMKDEWLTAAMTDDAVVVELLFSLKRSSEKCTPPRPQLHPDGIKLFHKRFPSPGNWGHRQPRSKPAATVSRKESGSGADARYSPTTPLSWSGAAASPSDGGYDVSSHLPSSSDLTSSFRSKVAFTNVTSYVGKSISGFRKRKAFLMDEENSILKGKNLAPLCGILNQQKDSIGDMKRIKQSVGDIDVGGPHMRALPSAVTHSALPRHTVVDNDLVLMRQKSVETRGRGFILPDLNTAPMEDDTDLGWN